MANHVNLVKLCVGVDSVEDLAAHIKHRGGRTTAHVTRMWPKQEDALLNGGSLYWVIKGVIQARQRIVSLEEYRGGDGVRRCAIMLDADLVRTTGAQRRPFQGWRYLKPEDAPNDLPKGRESEAELPADLAQTLADIGLL
ncbi:DUF1489 family protein [Celeribacter marinus]|uniref:DUF1489 family protein n=1 Tax=Celeribacter marinus TaxID=1397108 RepID=UPI003F6C3A86